MSILGLLAGDSRNPVTRNLNTIHALRSSGMINYVLIAAVFVIPAWIIGYISGLTPMLGVKSGATANMGISTMWQDRTLGPQKFWLFEGQTAYLRYDINWKNQNTTFRIHPMSLAGFSTTASIATHNYRHKLEKLGVKQVVKGTGSGVLVYVVPKSGFYQFYTDMALDRARNWRSAERKYSLSWGAYFGQPPAEILAAAKNNKVVAKAPKRRKRRRTRSRAKTVPVRSKPAVNVGKLRSSL